MPLLPIMLQEPLTRLFTEGATDPLKTATAMSDAYQQYTSLALFGAFPPVFTGLEKTLMKATILASLAPGGMNPASLANAWSTGITSWWLLPPIVVGAGVVSACPGALALVPAMTAVCSVPGQPAATAAAAMAQCIDIATRTTIATIIGSPVLIV